MLPTMSVQPPSTMQSRAEAKAAGPQTPDEGAEPSMLTVTPQQRTYLDALKAAGVKPSTDLLALSIGSYVCQARAAKQSEQGVWDFVVPLVRNDVRNSHMSSTAPPA